MSNVREISPSTWVDRTAGTSRAWKYDADAVRAAKRSACGTKAIGNNKLKHFVTARDNELALQAAIAHLATYPFERARSFLQRCTPVFAAEVVDGPAGQFVVGRKFVTRDKLLQMARAEGWQG